MMNDRFSKFLGVLLVLMSIAIFHNFRQYGQSDIQVTRLPARSIQPVKLPMPTSTASSGTEQQGRPSTKASHPQAKEPFHSLELIANSPSTIHSELEAKKAMTSLRICATRPGSHVTSQMQDACRNALKKITEKFPAILKDDSP